MKGRLQERIAFLSQQLGLSDAQRAQMAAIFRDEFQQIKAVRENSSLDEDQKKQQIRAIRLANRPKMLAILTPPQQQQLKGVLEEYRQQHPQQETNPPS